MCKLSLHGHCLQFVERPRTVCWWIGRCACCRPETFILVTGCNTSGGVRCIRVDIFFATLEQRGAGLHVVSACRAGLHVVSAFLASLQCLCCSSLCLFVVVPCLLPIALRYKVDAVVTAPFLWIYVLQADGGMSYSCMARL